jgi:hypothetical protein
MSSNSSPLSPLPKLKSRYAHVLRCLGQSLEAMELKALEVRTHGDSYIVQVWSKGIHTSVDMEKHYTTADIQRLEMETRLKRRNFPGPRSMLSLSEVLRLAGAYVDRAWGRLMRISWQDQSDRIQSVTIQYEPFSSERNEHPGDSQMAIIEELCIHMYKQRKKIAAGSDRSIHRPFVSVSNVGSL